MSEQIYLYDESEPMPLQQAQAEVDHINKVMAGERAYVNEFPFWMRDRNGNELARVLLTLDHTRP